MLPTLLGTHTADQQPAQDLPRVTTARLERDRLATVDCCNILRGMSPEQRAAAARGSVQRRTPLARRQALGAAPWLPRNRLMK